MAYIATDLDGHADVALTIPEAKRRAGPGCDTIIALHDISTEYVELEGVAVSSNPATLAAPDSLKDSFAEALHYPGCWDVMAYPKLADALSAVYDSFKCSQCAAPSAQPAASDMITLIRSLRPEFGAVGSRDVDVRAKQEAVDRVIAALASQPAAAASTAAVRDRLTELAARIAGALDRDMMDVAKIEASELTKYVHYLKSQPAAQQAAGSIDPSAAILALPLPTPSWARDHHGENEVYIAQDLRNILAAAAALAASVAPADTIAKLQAQIEAKDTQLRMIAEGMAASAAQPVPEPTNGTVTGGDVEGNRVIVDMDAKPSKELWTMNTRCYLASAAPVPQPSQAVPKDWLSALHSIRRNKVIADYEQGTLVEIIKYLEAAPVCPAVAPELVGWKKGGAL
jgi:hypothetical protein